MAHSMPYIGRNSLHGSDGFTLAEFLVVTALLVVISAVMVPAFSAYYERCCVKAAVAEIAGMIKEARHHALTDSTYYALCFNPDTGKVSLLSGRGADGRWNTADDQVVRSFCLSVKGGGLRFGYGNLGPIPGLAATSDGITFPTNNTLVCNPDLTGNAGAVYLITRGGAAMAIVMNSKDFGYKLWRWSGTKWERV